jgi:hypothetical protein
MDVDLQDPPALIPDMLDAVVSGNYYFACTRRITRKGVPLLLSFFAHCFYYIMSKLSKNEIVAGTRDFRLMNHKYLAAFLELKEQNRFLKGLFPWLGFRIKWFEYENILRAAGKTKWSFIGLFKYAINGIIAFSTKPLIIASILGFLIFIISIILIIGIVINFFIAGDPVFGRLSFMCLILMCMGLILSALGIIGLYLAKIYEEVKQRPHYIIMEEGC